MKFEFDVAISCAGENRNVAKNLATSLRSKGLSVFYDAHYRSRLWGKNQSEFERIYGPASRFVVPIISSYYKEKDWCRLEFGIARREATKRPKEFLLPIRLDDTSLLGLREDVFYVDLRQINISKAAHYLLEKIQPKLRKDKLHTAHNRKVQILSSSGRKALGIIAVCPFPLNLDQVERIFPKINWKKETRFLRDNGLLEDGRGPLRIAKPVTRALLSDPEGVMAFRSAWVEGLEPIKDHTDTALILALQYVGLKKFDEAIEVLAEIVDRMEPDWWNELYLTLFKLMDKNRLLRSLSPESRVRFYNAVGLCLSRMGKNEEGIKWFLKLRWYSKRIRST